jgi:NADH:ubiquinone oxidoreductase subunit 5 (subunit L)/multisubunit Na+/H+ antiporter MnhA subunit
LPLFAATLALAGALTAMCFVKVYGIAFLGRPREPAHGTTTPHSADAGEMERYGMAWLAAGCFLLGLFPTSFLLVLNRVSISLTRVGLSDEALADSGWLWLIPTEAEQASYSPIVFFVVIVAVTLLAFFFVRRFYHGRVRLADPWDCGFPAQTARMQDTADAFGQSIRHVFGPLYRMERRLPGPDDPAPSYTLRIEDRHWYWLYLPVARAAEFVSAKIALLQQGRIAIYLLYSFVTLIALLVFVR